MKHLIIALLVIPCISFAQNTITLQEGADSPSATLSEVAWIAGHWRGEAFGGITEEIWSPPLGNSMMFVFRSITDDHVNFYEVGHIQQKEETLILQLKHFHGNLKGWEEKDETVDFRLVKLEEGKAFFEGFTFEKISENEMNIYVVVSQKDGQNQELKFNYQKM